MNPYEAKFKEKLDYIKQSEITNSIRLEEIFNKLGYIEKTIAALALAIESLHDSVVIDAIENQIRISKESHQSWVATREAVIKSLESNAKDIMFLQDLCPHENAEVVSYNGHYNYDGMKCDLCDKEY